MPCVYNTVDSPNSSIHIKSGLFFRLVTSSQTHELELVDQLEPFTRFH